MTGLARANQVVKGVGFDGRSKEPKRADVMHRQLFAIISFGATAYFALVACAFTGSASLGLPSAVITASFCEIATPEIPMLFWVSVIMPAQTFAHAAASLFRAWLTLMRCMSLLSLPLHLARPGARIALICVRTLHEEVSSTTSANLLNFRRITFPRTKASVASCLIDLEHLTAILAGAIHLLQQRLVPAGARAEALSWLLWVDNEELITGRACVCFHRSIITQSCWQWC